MRQKAGCVFSCQINCIKNIRYIYNCPYLLKPDGEKIPFWGEIDISQYVHMSGRTVFFVFFLDSLALPRSHPWPLSVCLQARLSEAEKWLCWLHSLLWDSNKRLPHAPLGYQEPNPESCIGVSVRNSRRATAAEEMLCRQIMRTVHVTVKIVKAKQKKKKYFCTSWIKTMQICTVLKF